MQLSTGVLAVVASLKLQFAKTLMLGSAIGDVATRPVLRHARPLLKRKLNEDVHKWIEPVMNCACRCLVMSTAFWFAAYISGLHSAIQGGQLFATSLARLLKHQGVISFDPANSNLDEMAGFIVAIVGLWWQRSVPMPILLAVLLLPLRFAEWMLRVSIARV